MKIILICLIFLTLLSLSLTQKLGKRCYRKTQKNGNGWEAKERQRRKWGKNKVGVGENE